MIDFIVFGDCIHVTLVDGNEKVQFLIDTGLKGTYDRISNKLESLNKDIDFIILTHAHSDHISALPCFLEDSRFHIKGVVMWLEGRLPPSPSNLKKIDLICNKISEKKLNITSPECFSNLNRIIKKYVCFLNPSKESFYHDDPNRNSIVMAIKINGYYVLFMGDATEEEEALMIQRNIIDFENTCFLKLGHHGSETSSSTEFINSINHNHFKLAVCSCKGSRISPPPHKSTLDCFNDIVKNTGNLFKCTGEQTGDIFDIYVSVYSNSRGVSMVYEEVNISNGNIIKRNLLP